MIDDVPSIKKLAFSGPGVYEAPFKVYTENTVAVKLIFPDGGTRNLVKDTEYTVSLRPENSYDGVYVTVTTDEYSGGVPQLVQEDGVPVLQEDGTTIYQEGLALEDRPATFIVLERVEVFQQKVAWNNGSAINLAQLERSFDRVVMLMQQLRALVDEGNLTSNWRGNWVPSMPYYIKDIVVAPNGNWYVAFSDHVSSTSFNADLAGGKWILVLDIVSIAVIRTAAEDARDAAASSAAAADADAVAAAASDTQIVIDKAAVNADRMAAAASAVSAATSAQQAATSAAVAGNVVINRYQQLSCAGVLNINIDCSLYDTFRFFGANAAYLAIHLTNWNVGKTVVLALNDMTIPLYFRVDGRSDEQNIYWAEGIRPTPPLTGQTNVVMTLELANDGVTKIAIASFSQRHALVAGY